MRIGINVPNELLQRVKAIRPGVNVSQICREALEEYACQAERIMEQVDSDGMGEYALRLAEADGSPLVEPDWVGYALQDARDWVSTVDTKDWESLFHHLNFLRKQGRGDEYWPGIHWSEHDGKGWYHRWRENEEWIVWQYDNGNDSDLHAKAQETYARTWLSYVNEVRRMQNQILEERRKAILAERESAWQELAKPEIPPHLRG